MRIDTSITRVLVCEDSASYARALTSFLEYQGHLEVVAVCPTGEVALASISRLAPDLVVMDLEMPGIGGVGTIEKMMRAHPLPIVVLSAIGARRSDNVAAALAAGAVEVVDKTQMRLDQPYGAPATALRHRLRRLARGRAVARSVAASPRQGPEARLKPAAAIGICSSTGGPQALQAVLSGLPDDFPLPILVAQHMSMGFTDGLVRWLDQVVALPVALARSGASGPGVWIAPDDAHLILEPSMRLSLDTVTVNGAHRPSGDLLFASMARALGPRALGIVLTGMGRDGARGVAAIVRAGGCVIAQDEASSVVFGMPKAAVEQGAQHVRPLSEITGELRAIPLSVTA
jgi:two-component system, chemotaxis family, protein-glutamate methylesterase/glutaminase